LGAVAAIGALPLDAINVVERTQFLSLFARAGTYERSILRELSGPFGRLYETSTRSVAGIEAACRACSPSTT
jgi:uncharacterized protein YcaQ